MKIILKKLKNIMFMNSKILIGVSIILFLIIFIIVGSISGRTDEKMIKAGAFNPLLPPSFHHPLGTDILGRDYLSVVIIGFSNSLLIGILAGTIATAISVVIALGGGYKGGIIDEALSFLTNALLIIPLWPIIAVIIVYAGKINMINMALILSLFSWPWASRTIRAQVLSLKERPYIDLARVSGLSDIEIMIKEILPNLMPYVIVGLSNSIVGAIFAEVGLGIIGLGQAEVVTLGRAIYQCITMGALSLGAYNLLIPPILLIVLTFLSLNILNIGLDEYFNPRLKRITGK